MKRIEKPNTAQIKQTAKSASGSVLSRYFQSPSSLSSLRAPSVMFLQSSEKARALRGALSNGDDVAAQCALGEVLIDAIEDWLTTKSNSQNAKGIESFVLQLRRSPWTAAPGLFEQADQKFNLPAWEFSSALDFQLIAGVCLKKGLRKTLGFLEQFYPSAVSAAKCPIDGMPSYSLSAMGNNTYMRTAGGESDFLVEGPLAALLNTANTTLFKESINKTNWNLPHWFDDIVALHYGTPIDLPTLASLPAIVPALLAHKGDCSALDELSTALGCLWDMPADTPIGPWLPKWLRVPEDQKNELWGSFASTWASTLAEFCSHALGALVSVESQDPYAPKAWAQAADILLICKDPPVCLQDKEEAVDWPITPGALPLTCQMGNVKKSDPSTKAAQEARRRDFWFALESFSGTGWKYKKDNYTETGNWWTAAFMSGFMNSPYSNTLTDSLITGLGSKDFSVARTLSGYQQFSASPQEYLKASAVCEAQNHSVQQVNAGYHWIASNLSAISSLPVSAFNALLAQLNTPEPSHKAWAQTFGAYFGRHTHITGIWEHIKPQSFEQFVGDKEALGALKEDDWKIQSERMPANYARLDSAPIVFNIQPATKTPEDLATSIAVIDLDHKNFGSLRWYLAIRHDSGAAQQVKLLSCAFAPLIRSTQIEAKGAAVSALQASSTSAFLQNYWNLAVGSGSHWGHLYATGYTNKLVATTSEFHIELPPLSHYYHQHCEFLLTGVQNVQSVMQQELASLCKLSQNLSPTELSTGALSKGASTWMALAVHNGKRLRPSAQTTVLTDPPLIAKAANLLPPLPAHGGHANYYGGSTVSGLALISERLFRLTTAVEALTFEHTIAQGQKRMLKDQRRAQRAERRKNALLPELALPVEVPEEAPVKPRSFRL